MSSRVCRPNGMPSERCAACDVRGHTASKSLSMDGTVPVCPFIGATPWSIVVEPTQERRCGRCGWSNFRYPAYAKDGTRGYRRMGCGAIKPELKGSL